VTVHDPLFPVTCDGEGCTEEEQLEGTYYGSGGTRGGYRLDDDNVRIDDWVTVGDKHYCPDCVPSRVET